MYPHTPCTPLKGVGGYAPGPPNPLIIIIRPPPLAGYRACEGPITKLQITSDSHFLTLTSEVILTSNVQALSLKISNF